MAIEIGTAIRAINPSAVYGIITENGVSTIEYLEGTEPIEQSVLDAKIVELEAEYDAQEYARNRVADYPSQGDQNDMMYKDTKNSTTTHAAAVEAVKTKWPKDNSGPV
jgi:hypothetical protein